MTFCRIFGQEVFLTRCPASLPVQIEIRKASHAVQKDLNPVLLSERSMQL